MLFRSNDTATTEIYTLSLHDALPISERVRRYQEAAVKEAVRIMASMGVDHPSKVTPQLLMRRVDEHTTCSYAELYEWLEPGELVSGDPRESWAREWTMADPDSFRPR